MSCCASRRPPLTAGLNLPQRPLLASSPAGTTARPLILVFESTGRSPVQAVGAATGRAYRFNHPGARLEVDPRDAPALARLPGLRRL